MTKNKRMKRQKKFHFCKTIGNSVKKCKKAVKNVFVVFFTLKNIFFDRKTFSPSKMLRVKKLYLCFNFLSNF